MSMFAKSFLRYIFQKVLSGVIDKDLDLDEVDFSADCFRLTDIEINKGIQIPNFRLVSMTIKKIEIPWSLLNYFSSDDTSSDIQISGVDVILMPCPQYETSETEFRKAKENSDENPSTNSNSEGTLSASIISKFLRNFGLVLKDLAIRILP